MRKKMKILLTASLIILMAGCSMFPLGGSRTKPVEVVNIEERPPMFHPPLPMEMQLVTVDWEILTPEILQEYLKLVEEGKAPRQAYYALTTKDYENISNNMAEIRRYTRDILAIVEYYRSLDDEEEDDG
jgi:hypothetical protein